ncbi:hypothetical protein SALBM311S_06277 [Streptomyces alboniger]
MTATPSGARDRADMRLRRGARPATLDPHPATGNVPLVLSGANVVMPTGTVEGGQVVVEGTRITSTTPQNAQVIDVSTHWLVPGFVDIHNHGGGGASFTSGTVDEVFKGIHTHRLHGTTTLVASTVTGDMDFLAQRTGSHEPSRATQDARRRGAQAVVASLGAKGLLAVTPEGRWRAAPPAHVHGNPTGAGDSAVAGLLSGLVEKLPWPDRLARAVALSAATVLAPVAGEFDRGAYEELVGRVAVTGEVSAA